MKEFVVVVVIGILSTCWADNSWIEDTCDLDPEPGFCLLNIEKYFYNSSYNQCQKFIYSGCGGNDNRFDSRYVCQNSCLRTPIDEIGDGIEAGDDADEDEKNYKPSPPNFLGKLFQKSLFSTFDLFQPDPLFDVFQPDFLKDRNDDDDDDNDDKEEEEETREDNEEQEEKRNPFGNIFDALRPRFKPKFDLFPKRWAENPFGNLWSKTLKRFSEKVDSSFGKMSKGFEKGLAPSGEAQCAVCKGVIYIIFYEINVLKVSVETIVNVVQYICDMFPLATKTCDKYIADIRIIIKYLNQNMTAEEVCENIQLCPNTTLPEGVTKSVYISFKRPCTPLCNFMKATHEEKAMEMVKSWNASKAKLKSFCDDNKIVKKCDIFFRMFEKVFEQLSSITEKQTDENCKCFKAQPLFETKQFDSCLRCKQFEIGMINEAKRVNQSILALAYRVKEICGLFPSEDCKDVVSELRRSLDYNTVTLPNICNVTGYCENTQKKPNLADQIKKSLGMLRSIFPNPKPMIMRGMGLDLRKFSPDCLFCKKCMGDLKETFKKINETDVDSKGIYPAVKEGFSLYCQTRTVGTNYTTVCKKISDGIETVHEVVTKRGNEEGMCKMLGVC